MRSGICLTTSRLQLRDLVESDRSAFVELFMDPMFMVYAADPCTFESASSRFDRLLMNATTSAFSKRPIVELVSDEIIGYVGVAPFEFEGQRRLEFGYRLTSAARGQGYATEAGGALLDQASCVWSGTLMAMIDRTNEPSTRVINKLGFTFWKQADIDGRVDNLYQRDLP